MIFRTISGGRASAGQAASFPAMVDAVVKATGGNYTKAGAALGVDRRTVSRWHKGQQRPSARTAPLLQMYVRRMWLPERRENRLRSRLPQLDLRYRSDDRERHADQHNMALSRDVSARLIEAFLRGASPAELRAIFLDSIGDRFYADWIDAEDYVPDAGDATDYGFDVMAVIW